MARKRGRSVGDVTRYTGTSSRPPTFGEQDEDIPLTSGTAFVLIALVAFIVLCLAAVRFGTQSIQSDLTDKATSQLHAAGYDDVNVEASGNTLTITGSFTGSQSDEEAKAIVGGITGVGGVEGTIWSADVGQGDETTVVVGEPLEITWSEGTLTATGELSTPEKVELVQTTLEGLSEAADATITSVDVSGVTVKEGLEEETWLGPVLSLVVTGTERLPEGLLKADPANRYLAISGETTEQEVSDGLNDGIVALGTEYGFESIIDGVLVPKTGPTQQEVEDLQEDLTDLVLNQVVEFEVKSFQLTDAGKTVLDGVLAALATAPDVRVRIEGHTDDRGSEAANLLLSQQRAEAVLDYLVAHGESPDRFDIEGYGESQPRESNDTAEGRQANRRIEFIALLDNVVEEDGS